MAAQHVPLTTPREYLEREKDAKEKSEYVAGEIRAMAGGSSRHNRIKADVLITLGQRLLNHETCEPFDSDQKVRVSLAGPYYYPDVTVACDAYFDDDDCLLNPIVVFEVLSPSTEHEDRIEKWNHYRHLPSLQEYVLVAQDRAVVEHYLRQPQGLWLFEELDGMDKTLQLPSLGVELPLAALYRRAEA